MGIIALGIGFGTPLAIAGVVIHVAGHALAKPSGFYAALPLLRSSPRRPRRPPSGRGRREPGHRDRDGREPRRARGLPPSPLFLSELLMFSAGIAAGEFVVSAVAVIALALGFLGLLHALMEGVVGERSQAPSASALARGAADPRTHAILDVGDARGRVRGLLLPAPPGPDARRRRAVTRRADRAGPLARRPAGGPRGRRGFRRRLGERDRMGSYLERCCCTAHASCASSPAAPAARASTASSTWCRRRAGTSARLTTSTAFTSRATRRCGRSSATPPKSELWMTPVSGDGVHQVAVGPSTPA